jgi:hypothetical protein
MCGRDRDIPMYDDGCKDHWYYDYKCSVFASMISLCTWTVKFNVAGNHKYSMV